MSQSRPKSRRREWTLSPRDLPDPRLIKDEPLLQDLENNASYRLMVYRIRQDSHRQKHGYFLIGSLAIIFCSNSFFSEPLRTPLAIIGALLLVVSGFIRFRQLEAAHPFGLGPERFTDLLNAGISQETLLGAAWGMMLPSSVRSSFLRVSSLVLGIIGIIIMILFGWRLWLVSIPLFLTGCYLYALSNYQPYATLPSVVRWLRTTALKSAQSKNSFLLGCTSLAAAMLIVGLSGFAVVILASIASSLEINIYILRTMGDSQKAAAIIILLSAATGFFAGRRRGIRLMSDRERWIRIMRYHLEGMIAKALDAQDSGR